MDFNVTPRIEDFRARIARFVEHEILPLEDHGAAWDEHGNIALGWLEPLREKARAEGLWCLQLRPETGGQGLGRAAAWPSLASSTALPSLTLLGAASTSAMLASASVAVSGGSGMDRPRSLPRPSHAVTVAIATTPRTVTVAVARVIRRILASPGRGAKFSALPRQASR